MGHGAKETSQRPKKMQPGGRCRGSGRSPEITEKRLLTASGARRTIEHHLAAEQQARVGMAGRAAHILDAARFEPLAGIEHGNAVAILGDEAEAVGDEQHRAADRIAKLAQFAHHLRLDGDVERGRRLIGDKQEGPREQRHGDDDALAHAAAQFVRILIEALPWVRQIDLGQRCLRHLAAGLRVGRGRAAAQHFVKDACRCGKRD